MERITPPISKRLEALRVAQEIGFEVRARIDPIMTPPHWEEMYENFLHEVAHEYGIRPTMLTLGTYREKMPQLDAFRETWGLPQWSGNHRRRSDAKERTSTWRGAPRSIGAFARW